MLKFLKPEKLNKAKVAKNLMIADATVKNQLKADKLMIGEATRIS